MNTYPNPTRRVYFGHRRLERHAAKMRAASKTLKKRIAMMGNQNGRRKSA
jgi:hypothetical protein